MCPEKGISLDGEPTPAEPSPALICKDSLFTVRCQSDRNNSRDDRRGPAIALECGRTFVSRIGRSLVKLQPRYSLCYPPEPLNPGPFWGDYFNAATARQPPLPTGRPVPYSDRSPRSQDKTEMKRQPADKDPGIAQYAAIGLGRYQSCRSEKCWSTKPHNKWPMMACIS